MGQDDLNPTDEPNPAPDEKEKLDTICHIVTLDPKR